MAESGIALPRGAGARRAIGAALVLLGALAVVTRVTSLAQSDLTRNDFTPDYVSAKAWLDGGDPYDLLSNLAGRLGPDERFYPRASFASRNVHPPSVIVLTAPLAGLPYRAARVLWLLIVAACSAGAIALFARALGARRSVAAVAGVGALALPIVQKDLVYGQSKGLLLLLLVVAWRALRALRDEAGRAPGDDKQPREAAAGLALGAAAALNVFPLFMVVPLARMRRRRAIAWMLGSAAAIEVASALAIGLGPTRELISPATPVNFAFWRAAPMNLSFGGIPYRWLSASPWRPGALDAPGIAAVLSALLLAACVLAAARTPGRRSGVYWAAVPWMLLATPLVWDWYLLLVVPAAVFMLRAQPSPWALLPVALVAIGIPPGLPAPPGPVPDAVQVLAYSLPTYALVFLGVAEWRARASTSDMITKS